MFSIASINADQGQEPLQQLGPTKEAQESRLAQMYQDALLHMQKGRRDEARPLFEAILQDPLYAQEEAHGPLESNTLLQLRFLSFKNLAGLHASSPSLVDKIEGLRCYFKAATIDDKDVVVWHRAGALSSAVGRLDVARKAFEQGLKCSPRHWGCLEKLAEVLLAIGDEHACEKLAQRILKLEPRHKRANELFSAIKGDVYDKSIPGRGSRNEEKTRVQPRNTSEGGKEQSAGPEREGTKEGANGKRASGFAFDQVEPNQADLKRRKVAEVQKEEVGPLEVHLAEPSWSALVVQLNRVISTVGEAYQIAEANREKDSREHFQNEAKTDSARPAQKQASDTGAGNKSEAGEGNGKEVARNEQGQEKRATERGREQTEGNTNALSDGGELAAGTWTLQTPLVFAVKTDAALPDSEAREPEKLDNGQSSGLNGIEPDPEDKRETTGDDKQGDGPDMMQIDEAVHQNGGAEVHEDSKEERVPMEIVKEARDQIQAEPIAAASVQTDNGLSKSEPASETVVIEAVELLEISAANNRQETTLVGGEMQIEGQPMSKNKDKQDREGGQKEMDKSEKAGTEKLQVEGQPISENGDKQNPEGEKKEIDKSDKAGTVKRERRLTRALRDRAPKEKGKKAAGTRKEEVKKKDEEPKAPLKSVQEMLGGFVVGTSGKAFENPESEESARPKKSKQNEAVVESIADAPKDANLSRSSGLETFLCSVEENSGAMHVASQVLEELAKTTKLSLDAEAIEALLQMEESSRSWGVERSAECSLWLAQLHLDRAERKKEVRDLEYQRNQLERALREANRCLCEVIEWWAVRNAGAEERFPRNEDSVMEEGVSNLSRESGTHARKGGELSFQFWAKYEWALSRLAFLEGDRVKGTECLHMCVRFLEDASRRKECDSGAEALNQAGVRNENATPPNAERRSDMAPETLTIRLGCGLIKETLSILDVRTKLHEIETDELLTQTAAALSEAKDFEALVSLLAPMVLSGWKESADVFGGHDDVINGRAIGGPADVSKSEKRLIADAQRRLEGLRTLSHACREVGSRFLWTELWARGEILELLARTSGWLAGREEATMIFELAGISGRGEEKRAKLGGVQQMQEVGRMVGAELKEIGQCAQRMKAVLQQQVSQTVSNERVSSFQQLILDVTSKLYSSAKPSKSKPTAAVGSDVNTLIDGVIAFCRLQQLAAVDEGPSTAGASLEQQVALLASAHSLLAQKGLCCAGEGGGAFLKMSIQHLSSLDTKLSTSQNLEDKKSDEIQAKETVKARIEEKEADSPREGGRGSLPLQSEENKQSPPLDDRSDCLDAAAKLPRLSRKRLERSASQRQLRATKHANETQITSEVSPRLRQDTGLTTELNQAFFCLYGLNLQDERAPQKLETHEHTSVGEFGTQEQCAEVMRYIVPYAESCTIERLKSTLSGVLQSIHKQFPRPPSDMLARFSVEPFLDGKLSVDELLQRHRPKEPASPNPPSEPIPASDQNHQPTEARTLLNGVANGVQSLSRHSQNASLEAPLDVQNALLDDLQKKRPFGEVYPKLYFLLAQVEEINAATEAPGFALSEEGKKYFERMQSYYKYHLMYHPEHLASWEGLAESYDEEVDLLLNDGSKQFTAAEWQEDPSRMARVLRARKACRQASRMALALAPNPEKRSELERWNGSVLYDVIQNVVPLYDQRRIKPSKDDTWQGLCAQASGHFERSLGHGSNWEVEITLGRLSEKLGRLPSQSLEQYSQASESAGMVVHPVYRLHASRMKLLCEMQGDPKVWAELQDEKVSPDEKEGSQMLAEVAKHCFLLETVRKLKDIGITAAARGPLASEEEARKEAENASNEMGKDEALEGNDAHQKDEEPQQTKLEPAVGNESKEMASEGEVNVSIGDEKLQGRAGDVPNPDQQETATWKDVWQALYEDALAGLRFCMDGDQLKHFHKARYRVAHALLVGGGGELERNAVEAAKTELGFFFKTSRGAFTVNVWELDAQKKKKTAVLPGGRKVSVEQSLEESARKFATCVRKYLLLYLRLCELTSDWETLEKAVHFLRTDKKFCFFLSDLAQLAMGLFISVLAGSIRRAQLTPGNEILGPLLEQAFIVWLENAGSWKSTVGRALEEAKFGRELREPIPGVQEEDFCRYSASHIDSLARKNDATKLGSIYERLRKRVRNHRSPADVSLLEMSKTAKAAWIRALSGSLEELERAEKEKALEEPKGDGTEVANAKDEKEQELEKEPTARDTLEMKETREAPDKELVVSKETAPNERTPVIEEASAGDIDKPILQEKDGQRGLPAADHVDGSDEMQLSNEARGEKRKREGSDEDATGETSNGEKEDDVDTGQAKKRIRTEATDADAMQQEPNPTGNAATIEPALVGSQETEADVGSPAQVQMLTSAGDVAGPQHLLKLTSAGDVASHGLTSAGNVAGPGVTSAEREASPAGAMRRSRRSVEGGSEIPGKSAPLQRMLHTRRGEKGQTSNKIAAVDAPEKTKGISAPEKEGGSKADVMLRSALALYKDSVAVMGPQFAETGVKTEPEAGEEKNREAESLLLRAFSLVHGRGAASVDEVLRLHDDVIKKRPKKGPTRMKGPQPRSEHVTKAAEDKEQAAS